MYIKQKGANVVLINADGTLVEGTAEQLAAHPAMVNNPGYFEIVDTADGAVNFLNYQEG